MEFLTKCVLKGLHCIHNIEFLLMHELLFGLLIKYNLRNAKPNLHSQNSKISLCTFFKESCTYFVQTNKINFRT